MYGQTYLLEISKSVLQRCGSNPAEVLVFANDSALTRFANNAIHQNVAESNLHFILRAFSGKKVGTATTNRTDPASLDELASRALLNAQASPEDPNFIGLADPAPYTPVPSFDEDTALLDPQERAHSAGIVCRLASEKRLNASGAYSTESGEICIANSQGVLAYHASTSAHFQTTVMSEDSSGRAEAAAWCARDIPVESLSYEAIQKAERGRGPRKIEPGEFTVVFDPYATVDLLSMLSMSGMSGQAVLEGRSWMNDRLGTQAMSPLVNIWDDGLDPAGLPMPFDFEGTPKRRVDIVKDGVVVSPVYDRYTAHKAGKENTGHALPPTMRGFGPMASNLFMAPGQASTEELIRSTERGLYITRFWYTRVVHPRDCAITGMTRDGVFMIENGELAYPVKNLRFTQSYVNAMTEVETLGSEVRLVSSDYGGFAFRVPAVKIRRFNFTGSTV